MGIMRGTRGRRKIGKYYYQHYGNADSYGEARTQAAWLKKRYGLDIVLTSDHHNGADIWTRRLGNEPIHTLTRHTKPIESWD